MAGALAPPVGDAGPSSDAGSTAGLLAATATAEAVAVVELPAGDGSEWRR